MQIVAFLLTLSNKRGRQRFTAASILAGLQHRSPLPGFQNELPSAEFLAPRNGADKTAAEGEVFSDVEA